MENNHLQQHPTSENSNINQQESIVGSSEEEGTQVEIMSSIRLYECSFCKKGFSNAQALGGHMNIHRKDKAKLKQQQASSSSSSRHNLLPQRSIDSSFINPLTPSTNKWPPPPPQQDEQLCHESRQVALPQLPLSIETAAPAISTSTVPELDLELRLGVGHGHHLGSTRKFF